MGISQSSQAIYFNVSAAALLIFFFFWLSKHCFLCCVLSLLLLVLSAAAQRRALPGRFSVAADSLLPSFPSPLDLNKLSPFNLVSLPPCLTEPAGCSRLQTLFPAGVVTEGHEKLVQKEGEVEAGSVMPYFRRGASSEKIAPQTSTHSIPGRQRNTDTQTSFLLALNRSACSQLSQNILSPSFQ